MATSKAVKMVTNKKGGEKMRVSKSTKAGLIFPVGRIARILKKGRYAPRMSVVAPVFIAAILEYLTSEILELAGTVTKESKRARITPRHLLLAIKNDEDLDQVFKGATISNGGVVPYIHTALRPMKPASGANQNESQNP